MAHKRQIFLNESLLSDILTVGAKITLPLSEVHYLKNVLRLKSGAPIAVVSCQSEIRYNGVLQIDASSNFFIQIESVEDSTLLSSSRNEALQISLILSLCKGEAMDLMIEYGTICGVSEIIIWRSSHSIPIIKDEGDLNKRLSRWQNVAKVSASQSYIKRLPKITFFPNLNALAEQFHLLEGDKIICSLKTASLPLPQLMGKLEGKKIFLIIGPEGDFADHEEEFFLAHNALPLSLGESRFRADMAVLYALGMINGNFMSLS